MKPELKYTFLRPLFTLVLLFVSVLSFAVETELIIRAKAKDAKFIGSSIGGSYVIVKDARNNRILAEGYTKGSTGNTQLIMKTPRTRDMAIADGKTAKFHATIDINEPTFVTVEVQSPANHKQAQVTAQTQLWLIPGKHILGDGIVVEIPGFIIDILAPRTHQFITLSALEDSSVTITANVVMMCGCTISENGIWDANKMEVKALIKHNGKTIQELNMNYKEANLFEASLSVSNPSTYEVVVYAYDPDQGNTGVDQVNFVIRE